MVERSSPRKVAKRGTSVGFNVPRDVLADAGLERGDRVVVESDGSRLVVEKVEYRRASEVSADE